MQTKQKQENGKSFYESSFAKDIDNKQRPSARGFSKNFSAFVDAPEAYNPAMQE